MRRCAHSRTFVDVKMSVAEPLGSHGASMEFNLALFHPLALAQIVDGGRLFACTYPFVPLWHGACIKGRRKRGRLLERPQNRKQDPNIES